MDDSVIEKNWVIAKPLTIIKSRALQLVVDYRTVTVLDVEIVLTGKEYDILVLLMMNPKRVLTFEMISEKVWHEEYDICTRKTITSHICTLRKKLGTDYSSAIKSVHNIGYKYNWEVTIAKQ